jgi:hypothetical protein
MKISPIIVSILVVFACLTGYSQPTNNQTPVYSLFGITLGKQLPPNCTASPLNTPVLDEWGFLTLVSINPPQTNSAFDSNTYLVVLTPTNRLVCKIVAHAFHPDTIADPTGTGAFNGVRDALRQHYGKEDSFKELSDGSGNYIDTYTWLNGERELTLRYLSKLPSFDISCEDRSLSYHPPHAADTKGL